MEECIFTIISFSGDAKSSAMEAIFHAKKGDFQKADECLIEASKKLEMAHNEQTKLIQTEASGNKVDVTLLLVHAQDHLMNSIIVKDLAVEFVDLYKKL
jgi:PTS system cellobiose-specific IIA component